MIPFALTSSSVTSASVTPSVLTLDSLADADIDAIAEYCTDPLFERFMTTPWPYRRHDAVGFVGAHVPSGWATDREYTWALRADGVFMGVISVRRETIGVANLGYWIGAPFRGRGYMGEAVRMVSDWVFGDGGVQTLKWECVAGNAASASVARKSGFEFTGIGPAEIADRNGAKAEAWHGVLRATEPRDPKPGWPA